MTKPKKTGKPVVDHRGRMLVPLGDADYVLRPSFEAIEAIEQTLGRSLVQLASQAYNGGLSCADLAIIVAECMRAEGRASSDAGPSYRDAKAEKIARLIYEAGQPSITARIAILLTEAVTGGYTAAGEPKPAA
jgi:hypothetical protein